MSIQILAGPTMPGIAAAASIAQEKVTETVHFALTGDMEIDLITAIVSCFNSVNNRNGPTPGHDAVCLRMGARVCHYLSERFAHGASVLERQAEQFAQVQQMASPLPRSWTKSTTPVPAMPYHTTTSSGLGGMTSDQRDRFSELVEKVKSTRLKDLYQSGTHTPSTKDPDSTSVADKLRAAFDSPDGKLPPDFSGPG